MREHHEQEATRRGTFATMVGLALGTASLTEASATHTQERTLRFDIHFNDSWLGHPGLDTQLIQHDLLFAHGKQVGHTGGVCVVTDLATPEIACTVTFSLAGGTITTQFLTTPPPSKVFAITGGTGSYRQVRGHGDRHAHLHPDWVAASTNPLPHQIPLSPPPLGEDGSPSQLLRYESAAIARSGSSQHTWSLQSQTTARTQKGERTHD